MIDVIVGGKRIADLVQGDVHLPEVGSHEPESPRPADIDEQAGGSRADNPVVGRAVTYIYDRQKAHLTASAAPAASAAPTMPASLPNWAGTTSARTVSRWM